MARADQPPATTLRIDPDLRARLDAFAKATNRTMSGAIHQLVTEALDARDRRQQGIAENSM